MMAVDTIIYYIAAGQEGAPACIHQEILKSAERIRIKQETILSSTEKTKVKVRAYSRL